VRGQRLAHAIGARIRVEVLEIPDLALAKHQDAPRPEVFLETRQREPGLLGMRVRDQPLEPASAGKQFDREVEWVRPATEQGTNSDAWSGWHVKLVQDFTLIRGGDLEFFSVLRDGAPGEDQAF